MKNLFNWPPKENMVNVSWDYKKDLENSMDIKVEPGGRNYIKDEEYDR